MRPDSPHLHTSLTEARASIILILLLTSAESVFEMNFAARFGLSLELRQVRVFCFVFLLFESTWRIAWFKALYSLIGFLVPPEIRAWFFRPLSKRLPVTSPYHDWQKRVRVSFFPSFFFFFFSSLFLSAPEPS